MATEDRRAARSGLLYGPGMLGYYRFRIRETYLRDHVAPMLSSNRPGAVKLDLALRGMARLPSHLGDRDPFSVGQTLSRVEYPDLYEMVADGRLTDREAQRAWVRDQVVHLEGRGLAERYRHPYRGHDVRALADRGDGSPFDDPTGRRDDTYITVNGTLFLSGAIRGWGSPELAFYLAAMVGEAHNRPVPDMAQRGDGEWWRSYEWFADPDGSRQRTDAVRVPFSKRTLIRGRKALEAAEFVQVGQLSRNPDTGRAFAKAGRRNTYLNRFETRALQIIREQGIRVEPVPEDAIVRADA